MARIPILLRNRSNQECNNIPWMRFACALILLALVGISGCATLSGKQNPSEEAARCRLLSRQSAVAMEHGNFNEAIRLLEQAVEANPNDLESRRQLAESLRQQGALPSATKHMEMACQIEQHDPTLAVRAGEFRLEMGQNKPAKEWAEKALANDAHLSSAWSLRGRALAADGQMDLAMTDLYHALDYSPRSQELLWSIAKLHQQRGEAQRSLLTLHQLVDLYPPGEEPQSILVMEGETLAQLNRHHDAVRSLRAACERGQPDAEVLYGLAQSEMQCGEREHAIETLQKALQLNAGHQPSMQLLAQMTGGELREDVIRR